MFLFFFSFVLFLCGSAVGTRVEMKSSCYYYDYYRWLIDVTGQYNIISHGVVWKLLNRPLQNNVRIIRRHAAIKYRRLCLEQKLAG